MSVTNVMESTNKPIRLFPTNEVTIPNAKIRKQRTCKVCGNPNHDKRNCPRIIQQNGMLIKNCINGCYVRCDCIIVLTNIKLCMIIVMTIKDINTLNIPITRKRKEENVKKKSATKKMRQPKSTNQNSSGNNKNSSGNRKSSIDYTTPQPKPNSIEFDMDKTIYILFDLETTGRFKTRNKIIEIASICLDKDGDIIDNSEFASLINPNMATSIAKRGVISIAKISLIFFSFVYCINSKKKR